MSELTSKWRRKIERDAEATIRYTSASENSPSGHERRLAAHVWLLLDILASAESTIAHLTAETAPLKQYLYEAPNGETITIEEMYRQWQTAPVVRAAVWEAIEWLESRPDMTEGDAAVSSRLRSAFGGKR